MEGGKNGGVLSTKLQVEPNKRRQRKKDEERKRYSGKEREIH